MNTNYQKHKEQKRVVVVMMMRTKKIRYEGERELRKKEDETFTECNWCTFLEFSTSIVK